MRIKKKLTDRYVVICLVGEMEAYDAENLEKEMPEVLRADRDVVIDFDGLSYISSSGLRALLNFKNELAQRQKTLILAGLKDKVLEVFRISKLIQIFQICEDKDKALEL